ncbi:DUF928 domain-containing protein [Spirulina major]|uniref:DUF928 domain-containing protein n=1 Tax=Spirulina major TaxID=270636 RepID=UPI00158753A7|nr:DUF928 domain-containing protein [Spirulina major]
MLRRSLVLGLSTVLLSIAMETQGVTVPSLEQRPSDAAIAQIRRDRGAPDHTESHGGQAIPAPPEANQTQRRDRGAPERTDSLGGQVFTPPDIFVPGDTTRGGETLEPIPSKTCTTDPDATVQVLASINEYGQAHGLTSTPFPTLYAYIPPSTAPTGFLTLINADLETIAQIPIDLPAQGGIVAVNTAEVEPPLSPLVTAEWYEWHVTLICDAEIRIESEPAFLMRVEPDSTFTDQQAAATAKALPVLFGQEGLWYDALAASFEYHGQVPEDEEWLPEWQQLLLDGNLDSVLEALDLMPALTPEPLVPPTSPAR